MKSTVTGELIRLSALQLHHLEVSEARASEIARDVDRVNNVALAAAEQGDFNDEPSNFSLVLAQLGSTKLHR